MGKKLWAIVIATTIMIAFFAVSTLGIAPGERWTHNVKTPSMLSKSKLAGAERGTGSVTSQSNTTQGLGFDSKASLSPGLTIGGTYYDYQHNGRMTRQVDWRYSEWVHFLWMKKPDKALGELRGMGWQCWDADAGQFTQDPGGSEIHPISSSAIRSGYVSLDVDDGGKMIAGAHHQSSGDYMTTLWFQYLAGADFWPTTWQYRIPDSTATYSEYHNDEFEFIWPSHDYQVWDGDTITHVFAQQSRDGINPQVIAYFRLIGADSTGYWDYPPVVVDTVNDIGQMVTSSRVSGKVALVWMAGYADPVGDGESGNSGGQRYNDLYYAMSYDMGATWSTGGKEGEIEKFNVTKNDRGSFAWFLHTDLSCLIGTDNCLHVIWDAREWNGNNQSFPHFYGCRLFHWDECNDLISVVKDANWDLPDIGYCTGGAWNEMSIVKMSISECNNKLYALFTQYNDGDFGIYNDCHNAAFTAGQTSVANGELFISVSDNWGLNWDVARNLTNSRTPYCDTLTIECDSDMWASMSRFGMEVVGGDFTGVPVVDPSGEYSGSYYLDVFYVNDKYPGGAVQDVGVWTWNPMKWFRVPCVEPVPNAVISFTPKEIDDPTWTKPGTHIDTSVRIENLGNTGLLIDSIIVAEVTGTAGWLGPSSYSPISIPYIYPNFHDMPLTLNYGDAITTGPVGVQGYLVFYSNAYPDGIDSFSVYLIVADSVQFPEYADIRTTCTRIILNNAGNVGKGGNPPDGVYNLNYFFDCDTTENTSGNHDNAGIYLYDYSPFVLRLNDQSEPTMHSYIFDADWLSYDGMRPLTGLVVDSTTYPDYQWASTGQFVTKDSAIAIEMEYFAPTDMDSCKFIVMKQRVTSYTGDLYEDVYFGDLFDWDIPSDTSVENSSAADFDVLGGDASRDAFWCYGWEYGTDSVPNNDCVLANERLGGMAFYNGVKVPFKGVDDSIQNPKGPWWTHLNDDWVAPTGGFVASQIYDKINALVSGYHPWVGGGDSVAEDLHMIHVSGQFDIGEGDTLIFVKILAMEYDGGETGFLNTIDKARKWIENRPYIWSWPIHITTCCVVPGDVTHNGIVNILDITYLIAYLYKGGPAPPCLTEADATGNCIVNILDITYLIAYLYKGGPAPICGDCPELE